MIPQPYPLYVRTWIKGTTDIRTAAIIGWEDDHDGAYPQHPVVAFLDGKNSQGLSALLRHDTDEPDCWRITTDPNSTWSPLDELPPHIAEAVTQMKAASKARAQAAQAHKAESHTQEGARR